VTTLSKVIGDTVTGWDELLGLSELRSDQLVEQARAIEVNSRSLDDQLLILNDSAMKLAEMEAIEKSALKNKKDSNNTDARTVIMLNSKLKSAKENTAEAKKAFDLAVENTKIVRVNEKSGAVAKEKEEREEKLRLQEEALERKRLLQEESDAKEEEIKAEKRAKELEENEKFEKQFFLATQERLMKTATLKSRIATDNIRLSKIASDAELKNDLAVADQSIKLGKEVFGEHKLLSLAEIGMSTARGIMSALGSTPPNPVLAGFIGATGAVQAGKVANQKFAEGGIVQGQSTTGDRNQIFANADEMVLTKGQQAQLFSMANGNNQGGSNVTFNINAGAGTDVDSLALAVTNAVSRAGELGYLDSSLLNLEPQI
jgi:hypothetical protein